MPCSSANCQVSITRSSVWYSSIRRLTYLRSRECEYPLTWLQPRNSRDTWRFPSLPVGKPLLKVCGMVKPAGTAGAAASPTPRAAALPSAASAEDFKKSRRL